jgi:lipid-A-disaccharide synthase
MRLFLSAGEPSGDLHGANLSRALLRARPGLELHGFGGDRMAAAGCRLVYPLCDFAVIGFVQILGSVPAFRRILDRADAFFRASRPDALVLIDYPGFHWWLARRARARGIPVFFFVPPQIWAWATWRVRKMRRLVDHVLCALPFEEAWFRERGVSAEYVGHPYFDELPAQRLDGAFMAEQRARPGTVVGLLPGSRNQELDHSLEPLLQAAEIVHARRPDVRFLFACLRDQHARRVGDRLRGRRLRAEAHAGRTAEIIQLAHSTISVSGSVGLELLYRGKPSVVFYKQHWLSVLIARRLLMCSPYMSIVNLLAGRALLPEYLTSRCEPEPLAEHTLRWLEDRHAYERLCGELAELRRRVAEPGACDRAAARLLALLDGPAGALTAA